ncbi:MAG TPA: hypothetical protein VGH89_33820 [Pseudonocardia sp.]|jgi:hypothetical protein
MTTNPPPPTFGTRELYDALAEALNVDAVWLVKAKAMTFSMTHVYQGKIERAFRMEFTAGRISEVTVYGDPADAPPSVFVLTGDYDDWRDMLATAELSVNIALVSRKILVKGKMGALMKNIPQFNYIIGKLIELEPKVPEDAPAE